MPARGNVRDRSDRGQGEPSASSQEIARLEDRIRSGKGYYNAVSPAFVAGDAFVAMAMGYLRARPKLAVAATRNPGSFLAALSECARQGLVLGETYHIVGPFNDPKGEVTGVQGGVYCVGMRDYKGEIELMYRSGGVRTVVYDVIRDRDTFKRGRHPHEAPEFAPLDEGLASDADRGELKGVFAYAILESGAVSRVVVMGRDEIMRHREASRNKKLWDGPWEISAWLKTGIHELRKGVPTSAEYRVDQYRAMIAANQLPGAEIAAAGGDLAVVSDDDLTAPALDAGPGSINGEVERGQAPKAPAGKQQQTRERRKGRGEPKTEPPKRDPADIRQIVALMDEIGVPPDRRILTVEAILPQWEVSDPPALDDDQHATVIAKLREFIDTADPDPEAGLAPYDNWHTWISSPAD